MRILTRYILREVVSHALLGAVLFTFVLFTSRLRALLEIAVRNSASVQDVGRLVLYFLPEALIVTIPMAVLVGILLGLSRLAADSEITAMRASGMGALDFVRIVSLVSFGALALGLGNSLYIAPHAAASLLRLESSLKYAQASFELEPRVFDEDFKNLVLYVQDVRPNQGAAIWRHVFLADVTEPANPRITTADRAQVTSAGPGDLQLEMRDGGQHQISSTDANQYNISTFSTTDVPIQNAAQDDAHISRSDTPILALSLSELMRRGSRLPGFAESASAREKATRPYRIELHKRFSYPFACLVLMLVGVPLGLSSKRGGKSTGFVLTILLVALYYFVSSVGIALATQGKLSPFVGVWGANLIFAAVGILLLQQMSRGGVALSLVSTLGVALGRLLTRLRRTQPQRTEVDISMQLPQRLRSLLRIRFPLILDEYVIRAFAGNLGLVLTTFSMLLLVFTFFELIGDIIRNKTPLVTVGEYLLNLIPYILYNVTPLCVLVAVLVTFGALARSSEFTAMKAAGFSLYRVVTPVLVLTAVIALGLFAFDDFYLPAANRRQEALRAVIKGRPAQTFLRPDRQWISGQNAVTQPVAWNPLPAVGGTRQRRSMEPSRIFYYQFFDPDRNIFANLTVFEFDPSTFALQRRVFAQSARWDSRVNLWVFENGWVRTFAGETVDSYEPFVLTTFPEIHEQPQYFKKEDRPSQEMNFGELSAYIADIRQSGIIGTQRLSVQLNRKVAYPLATLVMAILAIPFALATGKRSGFAGFAIAILLAVTYLGVASLFEAMGNVNTLPASLAAWSPDLLFTFAGAWFLLKTPT
jgi:LPS export ABC transporter permease LptF/LPS export ABC transporter permease LptG